MSNTGTIRFSPCPPPSTVLIADINCIYAILCSQTAATRSHVVWQLIIRNVRCRLSTYTDSQRQCTYYLVCVCVCVCLGLGRLVLRFLDHTQLDTHTYYTKMYEYSKNCFIRHVRGKGVAEYRNFPDIRMLIWWPG